MRHAFRGRPALPPLLSGLLLLLLGVAALAPPARSAPEAWTALGPADAGVICVAVAPGNSALLLAGGDALHRSADGGAGWSAVTGPTAVQVVAFGLDDQHAWAGCWGGGVWRSTDGGVTWQAKNSGLTNLVVRSLVVSPVSNNVVYATTEQGLYKSTNMGGSWTRITGAVYTSGLAICPAAPQVLVVGTGAGLLRSVNGGTSWSTLTVPGIDPGVSPQWLAFDPGLSDVMYAMYQGYGGLYVSRDAGLGWQPVTPGMEGFCVATDPGRGSWVYGVGGWAQPHRSSLSGVAPWDAMDSGWNPGWFARGITVDPNDSAVIYGASPQAGVARWEADVLAPAPPTDLGATDAGVGIRLTWTASPSPDVAGYRVFRATTGGTFGEDEYRIQLDGAGTTTWLDRNAAGGVEYTYVVEAVDGAQNRSDFSNEATASVTPVIDLDVTWLELTPHDRYRYAVEYRGDYEGGGVPYLRPGTEGEKRWPAYNESMTVVGHVRNRGNQDAGAFDCRFAVNGVPQGIIHVPGLAALAEATVDLPLSWPVNGFDADHGDFTVTLAVDIDDTVPELYEANNSLTDFMGGLALNIYTDQATYDALSNRVNRLGTMSFEDWFQEQIREMNAVFARSIYPGAPNGALERVRIDRITIGEPPESDRTEDGDWYLTGGEWYGDTFAAGIDEGLIHELMHQIGMIDLYQINMEKSQNHVTTPDGQLSGLTFDWGRPGMMGGGDVGGWFGTGPIFLSRWDVLALNRNTGYRRGYYGEMLYDLPDAVRLHVTDSDGVPVAGAQVRLFQRQEGQIADVPAITGTTDGSGYFTLPNRPPGEVTTTATGHTLKANPFATIHVVGLNALALIEVSRPGGDFDHQFLPLPLLNERYWDGETALTTVEVPTRLAATAASRITDLRAGVEGNQARLAWSAVPGATGYTVYRASRYINRAEDPAHAYENWRYRPLVDLPELAWFDPEMDEGCRYAVAPILAGGRHGPLSNRAFAPLLQAPRGVAVQADGQRAVLDPQNGYALIRQGGDGTFLENFGSVHNHLEYSNYMEGDAARNRLVISHPADYYSGRQSVKVTDLEGVIVLEIGDTGSGPGQFLDVAGVAVDGAGRIFAADNGTHRVQAFAPDGTFLAEFGAGGSGPGEFGTLRGLGADDAGRVFVCDAGNNRVAVLGFDGALFSWLGALEDVAGPNDVAVGTGGVIYVSNSFSWQIRAYSSTLTYMRSFNEAAAPHAGPLLNPTGMAVDAAGNLVVCDTGNRRVVSVLTQDPAGEDEAQLVPPTLVLRQNRPNPFAGGTAIAFEIPRPQRVTLRLFDTQGRLVRTLLNDVPLPASAHEVLWDGRSTDGASVPSGLYFYRLETAEKVLTKRMLRLK